MKEAGLTDYEILRSATKEPDAYFHEKDRFGTIEVGARADLVLLNQNPLADIAHLQDSSGVMVRGRWVPYGDIVDRLESIANTYLRRPR